MATCKFCGTNLEEGQQICSFCGTNNAEQTGESQQVIQQNYQMNQQDTFQNGQQMNQQDPYQNGQQMNQQNANQYGQQGQFQQNTNQYGQQGQYQQNANQFNQQGQYQQNTNQYGQQGQYQNANQQQYQYNSYNQKQSNTGNAFNDFFANITNTADYTATMDPNDAQSNKGISVCAYLSILFLLPLLCAQESRFARFHANQGLVLWLTSLIWSVATFVVSFVFAFTGLGVLIAFAAIVSRLGSLLILVLVVLGIINVVNGQAKDLPLIGKFRLIK